MLDKLKLIERLKRFKKIMWAVCALVFLFGFAFGGLVAFLTKAQDGTIVRGVFIGPFDVGGLTPDQASQLIAAQTAAMEARGVLFKFGDISSLLGSSIDSETNSELSVNIFKYAPESALDTAIAFGRNGSTKTRMWQRLAARLIEKHIILEVRVDQTRVQDFLRVNFSKFETKFQETALTISFLPSGAPDAKINPGKPGAMFDYDKALQDLVIHLSQFDYNPIGLRLEAASPKITPRQVQEAAPEVLSFLKRGDIALLYEDKKIVVKPTQFASWFGIALKDGKVKPILYEDKVFAFLQPFIALFEQPVIESRFKMIDNRIVEFQPPREGRSIDMQQIIIQLENVLFNNQPPEILVQTIVQKPKIDTNRIDELGIRDLVGTATTRFTGSPKNRRANIGVGAASLNGLLIAPGEEFSVVKALGKIDRSTGYLPELVIKENRTTPEFGGGLCQVSTTVFRSVMSAGLPVTERSNHAYRVSYYEPAGKDATIYSPKPDFKFFNDTSHYILIQTRISGDALIVELWGTPDGRTAWQSDARVYNIVSPPEPKLIETTEIPVGSKKCTERAHFGADAFFTYAITYPDGRINKRSFFSRYKPWREVCLLGVEKKQEPAVNETTGL